MPDYKPKESECERHLDIHIIKDSRDKWCGKCGKIIKTYEDERKIKRTHDEGC
jgi:hypothetical protein